MVRDRLRDRMRLSGEVAEGVSRQDCMDQALQLMPFAVMRVSVLFVCSGLFLAPERINESISNAERKLEGYSESDFEADRDAGLDRLAQSKAERGEVGNPLREAPARCRRSTSPSHYETKEDGDGRPAGADPSWGALSGAPRSPN